MRVIRVNESCEIKAGNVTRQKFKKDNFYILSDDLAKRLYLLLGSYVGPEIPFYEIHNKYDGQDLNGKKLLCIRHGGGGDILFMTTAIAELKRRYPRTKIGIAISEFYLGLVENNPNIDEIYTLPISLSDWNNYHYQATFEGLIENNKAANQFNAYDLFMGQLKMKPSEIPASNKIPEIFLTEDEKKDIAVKMPILNSPKKKIGVQVEASSPIRKYPPHSLIAPLSELASKGYLVFLFGSHMQENSINYVAKGIGNSAYPIILPLREAVLVSSFMDYFIAPDSMFIHIAGALRIPVLGIYGPFHSDLRMKYFIKAIGINAKTQCSPCFQHGHFPCEKGEPSPCFSLIDSNVILQTFEKLVEWNGADEIPKDLTMKTEKELKGEENGRKDTKSESNNPPL